MTAPTVDRLTASREAMHAARRDLSDAHVAYMAAIRRHTAARKRHEAELADAHRRAGG